MGKPLVIVGTGLLAEQVHYYLGTRSGRAVDAFVLDAAYIREPRFLDRPVLDFAEAQEIANGSLGRSLRELFFAPFS